jgi:hypothetical protein
MHLANADENAATKFLEFFAARIDQHPGSPQTIKQHLAAIKMLFDCLVVSQVVRSFPTNPAVPR